MIKDVDKILKKKKGQRQCDLRSCDGGKNKRKRKNEAWLVCHMSKF